MTTDVRAAVEEFQALEDGLVEEEKRENVEAGSSFNIREFFEERYA